MPRTAPLRIVPPPVRADLDGDALRDYLDEFVSHYEAQARARVRAEGRPVLGAKAVLAQDPSDRPRTREPRRQLNPRLAARNKWARLEAIRRIGEFILRYRTAYQKWKEGTRDVVFPLGTYGMRVFHQVAIAGSE
jgi:putative transposase